MNPAKIRLSPNEMELVTNADWILTKNGIMRKAWHLLEGLQEYQKNLVSTYQKELPSEALHLFPEVENSYRFQSDVPILHH